MKKLQLIGCLIIVTLFFTCFVNADIVNGNFETGNLTGWTKTGTAWDDSPETIAYWPAQQVGYVCDGTYFALSRMSPYTNNTAETAMGTLRSSTFSIPENHVLAFLICGWSKFPADPSNYYNYVSIKRTSDDTEVAKYWAYNGNTMTPVTFEPTGSLYNVDLYVEVVNDCSLGGYAWLSVDDFKVEEADPRNWDFETGTYTNLYSVFILYPVVQKNPLLC